MIPSICTYSWSKIHVYKFIINLKKGGMINRPNQSELDTRGIRRKI